MDYIEDDFTDALIDAICEKITKHLVYLNRREL